MIFASCARVHMRTRARTRSRNNYRAYTRSRNNYRVYTRSRNNYRAYTRSRNNYRVYTRALPHAPHRAHYRMLSKGSILPPTSIKSEIRGSIPQNLDRQTYGILGRSRGMFQNGAKCARARTRSRNNYRAYTRSRNNYRVYTRSRNNHRACIARIVPICFLA